MPLWNLTFLVACLEPSGPATDPGGDPPSIASIEPRAGAVGVAVDAPIVVRFSEPVAHGSGSAVLAGGREVAVTLSDAGDELTLVPVQPLGSLLDVEVQVSGFTDLDGLAMEAFTSTFQTELVDRLEPRPPSGPPGPRWALVDVAESVGITAPHEFSGPGGLRVTVSSGQAVGDYDNDGFLDVFTGRGDIGATHLYRNLGDGTFADVAEQAGVRFDDTTVASPSFVDYDGDGHLDLLAPRFDGGETQLFRNEGTGTFRRVPGAGGLPSGQVFSTSWGDFDGDADLDVFFTHFDLTDSLDPQFLYRNEGDGSFTDATASAGLFFLDIRQSFTANFADMDEDGWPELLVAGDHHYSVYLRNDGTGAYTVDGDVDLTDENGMGATVADFDNDGDIDWFVAAIYDPNGSAEGNWGTEGNRLYENQGDGHLVDISEQAGVRDAGWAWGSCAADLDLDGFTDLFVVNGWTDRLAVIREEYTKDRSRVFRNNGDGTFEEISLELGLDDTSQGRNPTCLDYDRDGDIDLLVTTFQDQPRLFRNDARDHGHFLNVRLDGRAPNTWGVGARVYVTAGGTTQLRELRLGSNYGSNDPVEAHFGLGRAQRIEELRVVWPDGQQSVAHDVAADRFVEVSQP